MIATAGAELTALARRQHCDLFYEASVAGGIPILRTLTDSYATDNIQSVDGIINGTANYILSAMTAGQTYEDALAAAQAAGYAEADPTNDVGGIDAAYKLMILSRFAFGQGLTFQQVAPVGITGLSATICQTVAQHGWQIKLLAQATQHNQQLYCRVAPMAVAQTQPLSEIAGVQNAIAVQSDAIGASLYTGPGAGSTATANSVLNDVIVAAQHLVNGQSAVNTALPVNQGAVTNLADLPQDYLVVGAKAVSAVQVYANEVDFSLQTLAPDCLRLNALTARQRQQVARQVQVTLVPIAGTVRWPATTKNAITTPVHVAI